MATDDKSSPTLESASELPRSPSSPSHLTHFKPLTPDQDDPPFKSAYSSFVNLFRFNKDEVRTVSAADRSEAGPSDPLVRNTWSSPHHSPTSQPVKFPVQYKKQLLGERLSSTSSETRRKPEPSLGHDPRTAVQLRSLSTVVKRLKEIMEGKSQDSDLKQYWMPDSQCKECYDCNEKFTTFRRRHHCRLCGQIFCSRCCNQEIPGKFMGYTGDLRACTYCCKIAINYAHSADGHTFGEDLNALSDSCSLSVLDPGEPRTPVGGRKSSRNIFLEEDLAWQSLLHQESTKPSLSTRLASVQEDGGKSPARNRSASITNLSLDRSGSPMIPSYESSVSPQASRTYLKNDTNEEERKILLDSVQLKELWKKICHHNSGMEFQDHRYWLRTYPNCIVGKELVNWLIRNGHVTTRAQAIAIGQALVDGRWLDCITHHDQLFRDEYALYRPLQSTEFSETPSPDSDSVNSVEGHSEPSWFKDIKFDDSDTEQIADEGEDNLTNFLQPEDGGQQMISISDAFIKESLFNRRVEEKSKDLPFTPLGWHHNTLDQLREENGEKQAMERLLSANHSHMMSLLQQLLYNESLSLSWQDVIVPVVCQVVQTVRPDVKNDDDMDIRQYIHIKKIPGGKKVDSMVVNGFVCTKNIAHKKMNPCIKGPKILLLKCSIEYLYREETKFTCIDPIVLQEREFLKNYVQRIVDVRPTLVLVEKTVSRIAQDMLLEHGITLAINVKPQVLDRVSRMTQGDLVMSMDQLLTKPRLGTCNKFYIQVFPLLNDESKTLMFFEGCPQHLGCTIKLSGGSEYELARVKDIIIFMVYAAYHSQLEISFLMDEFAMPPTLPKSSSFRSLIEGHEGDGSQKDLFNGEDCSILNWETNRSSDRLQVISESQSCEDMEFIEQRSHFEETGELESKGSEVSSSAQQDLPILLSNSSHLSSVSIEPELFTQMCLIPGISKDDEVSQKFEEEEPKNELQIFRDPLQDDTGLYITAEVASTDDRLKVLSISFKQELKDVILCISPIISFKEPFLLTEKGTRCPTRDYFPEQVYMSPLLNKEIKEMESRRKKQLLRELSNLQGSNENDHGKTIEVLPSHELLSTKIAEHLGVSQNLARILADYRARGGRIRQKDVDPFVQTKETSNGILNKHEAKCDSEEEKGVLEMSLSKIDCLSVLNHQRLCVLFSSSSAESNNAPSACVSPWIVTMEFYGKNDLTLGVFLERYCFRPSYQCPSVICETPMVHHIRRFVHGNGCVQIILKELDSPVPGYQHTILTYSWCRICQQVTPVVPLSNESWSMSFAKYLQLRFYGNQYTRRANAEPCGHSIHHNYHQYFSYNQMVASFSYSSIRLLEVCVPMPKIYIKRHTPARVAILQDLKDFSQKVTQVYCAVDDRLTSLKTDTFNKTREEKMEDLFAKKEMEEVEFRKWIEPLQGRMLCSNMDSPQQLLSVFESIIVKKQSLCEILHAWNNRLQDLFQQEKGRKRPSVPASPGRMRQGDETKVSGMDASPRNSSPAQNGDREDRFMTTLSQSSTGSTHLQIPSPPELVTDHMFTGAPNTVEMDTASSCEDVFDGHLLGSTDSQVKEKSTMKAIFANLLPGNNYNPIPLPFDPDKHYLMYEHERVPIAVCEKEPSSIIAFALSCKEYITALDDLSKVSLKICPEEGALPSSMMDNRPKTSSPAKMQENSLSQPNHTAEAEPPSIAKKASGVLSFFRGTGGKSPDLLAQRKETLRGADSAYYQVGQMGKDGGENQGAENQDDSDGGAKQKKHSGNPHVELQFSDANAKFYCRIYYAEEFHRMRKVILGSSEEDFIRSLAHCVPWQARGGKSGAAFYATEDDRFILKQMPRLEVQSFLDFAPHYFTYITNAVQMKRPTALAKILGVYRIGYKNSQNNTEKKLDLLVMENLFYGRKMAQVFDLKGSLRNRNVKTDIGKESCELVLLDENLLKMVQDNPLYIRSHCKSVLRASIHSDSHFLSSHLIIDYSLLVGRDDTSDELVVGIIDYIRTFTWDKKLEMVVKSTGILGGQGKMPTVVSPELYRTRFCEAMDKYFLMVPDHWTGLGGNC
ncbi:1-phosphatidylinositol 3-phosphate 5-kinase isoform 2-T3 [Anomaloglossus baeobatrachus]|uniref:1-phosphatidylinositol 3-phosphate 5-kinase isoform X2 n=1 Tax=Anomaloglossus baeobatrachus TaxID=238106 RepID=UPI003F507281